MKRLLTLVLELDSKKSMVELAEDAQIYLDKLKMRTSRLERLKNLDAPDRLLDAQKELVVKAAMGLFDMNREERV